MDYKNKYKRKNFVLICFNDEEIKAIDEMCQNTKKAKFLREICLARSKEFKSIINKNTNKKLAYELNKIGINLNQIARKINQNVDKFLSGNGELFVNEIDEIEEQIKKIKGEIYG